MRRRPPKSDSEEGFARFARLLADAPAPFGGKWRPAPRAALDDGIAKAAQSVLETFDDMVESWLERCGVCDANAVEFHIQRSEDDAWTLELHRQGHGRVGVFRATLATVEN